MSGLFSKKNRTLLLIVVTAGVLFLFLNNRASQDQALAEEISSLIEQGATEIDLRKLTTFEWTKVDVVEPYTSDEMIEQSMAITFKGDNGGIGMLDDRLLLVFANDKYAVKTVVLSRENCIDRVRNNEVLMVCKQS